MDGMSENLLAVVGETIGVNDVYGVKRDVETTVNTESGLNVGGLQRPVVQASDDDDYDQEMIELQKKLQRIKKQKEAEKRKKAEEERRRQEQAQ